MNIFCGTIIFSRYRDSFLKKELYKQNILINQLTEEKNLLEESLLLSLTREEIIQKANKSNFIDTILIDSEKIINYIDNKLKNNGNIINFFIKTSNYNKKINNTYIIHDYENLEPTTFAPSYPVRFKL